MISTVRLLGVLLLALAFATLSYAAPLSKPIVLSPAGSFIGKTVGKVDQFLGIPFEAKPVRFSPAFPPPYAISFDATKQPPGCIQADINSAGVSPRPFPDLVAPVQDQDEDCLKLNIYRPAGSTPKSNLAVMFWIYGGGFAYGYIGGSPVQDYYDGSSFAEHQNVIIVEANYRLSVWGFPGAENDQIPMAQRNPGVLDLELALRWVQANIKHFGGDPAKVTLFGVSAGGALVDELMLTQGTSLFRAGIIESGSALLLEMGNIFTRTAAATKPWNNLTAQLGCTGTSAEILTCVRNKPIDTVRDIVETSKLQFEPTYDGNMLASNQRVARQHLKLNLLVGHSYEDGIGGAPVGSNIVDTIRALPDTIADLRDRLIADYTDNYPSGPGQEYENEDYKNAGFVTDVLFNCPASEIAFNAGDTSGNNVYRYVYNASFANLPWGPLPGVVHSSEVPLVFENLPSGSTEDEMTLSTQMQTWWANFAKDLNPGPGWGKVAANTNEQVALNVIDTAAGNDMRPSVRQTSSRYGGSERCYPDIDEFYTLVDALWRL